MDNRREPPNPDKGERVQIVTNDEFQFLDMKMRWYPEGDLQFGVFRKKGQQLSYVRKESTHTPGSLRAFPSGVLNRLDKLTSRKTLINSERGKKNLPQLHKCYPQGGPRTSQFPDNGIIME